MKVWKHDWNVVDSSIHPSSLMFVHAKNKKLCGYVCLVDEKSWHCYTCGADMPEMYEEMLILGQVFFLPIKANERHWIK